MVLAYKSPAALPSRVEPASRELDLRRRLGIPDSAQRVIIFGETSHWDLNWLYSSEEYYERRVRVILDTNVLVSALITRGTPPDRLYEMWRRGRFSGTGHPETTGTTRGGGRREFSHLRAGWPPCLRRSGQSPAGLDERRGLGDIRGSEFRSEWS